LQFDRQVARAACDVQNDGVRVVEHRLQLLLHLPPPTPVDV